MARLETVLLHYGSFSHCVTSVKRRDNGTAQGQQYGFFCFNPAFVYVGFVGSMSSSGRSAAR